jgi:hypothetical protein
VLTEFCFWRASIFSIFAAGTVTQKVQCAHPLFSELEELILNKEGEPEWKETARSDSLKHVWSMQSIEI